MKCSTRSAYVRQATQYHLNRFFRRSAKKRIAAADAVAKVRAGAADDTLKRAEIMDVARTLFFVRQENNRDVIYQAEHCTPAARRAAEMELRKRDDALFAFNRLLQREQKRKDFERELREREWYGGEG